MIFPQHGHASREERVTNTSHFNGHYLTWTHDRGGGGLWERWRLSLRSRLCSVWQNLFNVCSQACLSHVYTSLHSAWIALLNSPKVSVCLSHLQETPPTPFSYQRVWKVKHKYDTLLRTCRKIRPRSPNHMDTWWSCLTLNRTLRPSKSALPSQTGSSSLKSQAGIFHIAWDCLIGDAESCTWDLPHAM